MGIQLDLPAELTNPTVSNSNAGSNTGGAKRPPATFYCNVGKTLTNPYTGETEFVSIGGFAMDNINEATDATNSESYNWLLVTRNTLIRYAKEFLGQFQPNQEEIVDTLEIQFRRVKGKEKLEPITDKEMNSALQNLFSKIPANASAEEE